MVANKHFAGSRLIRIEYGTVGDFSIGLPYESLFYFLLIFKKGNEIMTDVWRLPEKYPDFTLFLNKTLDRKEGNAKTNATYHFTDGNCIIIS